MWILDVVLTRVNDFTEKRRHDELHQTLELVILQAGTSRFVDALKTNRDIIECVHMYLSFPVMSLITVLFLKFIYLFQWDSVY